MVAVLVVGLLICAGALCDVPDTAGAAADCANARLRPNGENDAAIDRATLCLIDRIRVRDGLRRLRSNAQLGGVAAGQVQSMLRWNYFADVRPAGQSPLALALVSAYRAHAARISVGQNIAWATSGEATPADIVAAWMASPPHRAIILDGEYRDAGAAVEAALPSVLGAGRSGALFAVEFGARR